MFLICTNLFYAVIQYFVSPLLAAQGFILVLLSNFLFMVAFSYYHYLNFLGYDGKFLFVTHAVDFNNYAFMVHIDTSTRTPIKDVSSKDTFNKS